MKKTAFAAISAALILITNLSVFSAYDLSLGMDILKSRVEVKKCGVVNDSIGFAEDDFDKVIGKAEYITVMTLPEKVYGRLVLGGKELVAGQTLTRRSLAGLSYIPSSDTAGTASFTFRNAADDGTKYGVCTLYVLEQKNSAPISNEMTFDTSKNITCKGFLKASDPDGDTLTFFVVSGARHGTMRLLDEATGHFMYTPAADFTGRDIFSFRTRDEYGNTSDAVKVIIHVSEPDSDTVFYDMTNHWAHNCAIEICADGVMNTSDSDGKKCFFPDNPVSRGDFLAISMIAAGLEEKIMKTAAVSFTDSENIPQNIQSYAESAFAMGIITGYPNAGGVSFESSKAITRGEASAIISRIIELKQESVNTISNIDGDISHADGILVGTGFGELSPKSAVTRAQTAQIYCRIKALCNNDNSSEKPQNSGIIGNLFALFRRRG